jgi:prepilin-type N-terminal cleavage/methylation domain-containing protein
VQKRRNGFTLFEMVLVLAIVVILAAMAYPALSNLVGKDGLSGKRGQTAALDDLRGKLAEARSRAMDEGRPYRVAVMPGKGNFRVAPDGDQYWGGSGQAAGNNQGRKPLVLACALPHGSRFADPDAIPASSSNADEVTSQAPDQVSPSAYQKLVVFRPDGTARDDARIAVVTVGTRPVVCQIRAMTSNLTTQEE